MGRKLLADPELPRRLAEGRAEAARPCVYAYRCVGNVFLREASRCVVNPALGREAELAPRPASRPRRVAVVGGGPAGLELARGAAQRGHRVRALRARGALGGRARLAARLDPEIARWLRWLEARRARRASSSSSASRRAPARLAGSADVFVVATGARRVIRRLAGGRRGAASNRSTASTSCSPSSRPGRRIVVSGSDVIGVKAAEALAQAGHAVTLLESSALRSGDGAAAALARGGPAGAARRQARQGVPADAQRRRALPHGEARGGRLRPAGRGRRARGRRDAGEALRALGAEVHAIGDCRGPRYLEAGLLEAARLAAASVNPRAAPRLARSRAGSRIPTRSSRGCAGTPRCAEIGATRVFAVATWALVEQALARSEAHSANLTGLLDPRRGGRPRRSSSSAASAMPTRCSPPRIRRSTTCTAAWCSRCWRRAGWRRSSPGCARASRAGSRPSSRRAAASGRGVADPVRAR